MGRGVGRGEWGVGNGERGVGNRERREERGDSESGGGGERRTGIIGSGMHVQEVICIRVCGQWLFRTQGSEHGHLHK